MPGRTAGQRDDRPPPAVALAGEHVVVVEPGVVGTSEGGHRPTVLKVPVPVVPSPQVAAIRSRVIPPVIKETSMANLAGSKQ
ncbi:hypothetical protein Pme01_22500 [Planosporangium mesophilum]|uniref:Uncharacterized protein n=1 Tax=Planosporangium mesophilum TaxID=689768 RepID=A0A8J3X3A3_9ACTN|nr:hypothetical protein Pme01_22500 [Planosporangium mesophilum]